MQSGLHGRIVTTLAALVALAALAAFAALEIGRAHV